MNLNLKIPPVAQGLIAASLIWVCSKYIPLYQFVIPYQIIFLSIMSVVGVIIVLASGYAFRKMGTTVDPRYPDKVSALVVFGIYKYSRNPMYVGMLLVLLGVAIYFGAISGFIVPVAFVFFITKFQIKPEEEALKEKFGEDYERYLTSVRRWI